VLRYPAIAEHDEIGTNKDGNSILLRHKGEELFPEHKPLDFLLERRTSVSLILLVSLHGLSALSSPRWCDGLGSLLSLKAIGVAACSAASVW
jgi:hypothetical protein